MIFALIMNTRSAPYPTKCYCALTGGAPLVPYEITRRAPEENDVAIDIEYVGICHSDIHFVSILPLNRL